MTEEQIEDFKSRRDSLDALKGKAEEMLIAYSQEGRRLNLTCDHKFPDGSLARGLRGEPYLCKICCGGADFDTMQKRMEAKKSE